MATNTNGPNALTQPRAAHRGPNFMDGAVVSTTSQSTSETFVLFQLPDPCFVIRGVIKGTQPSGESGQVVLALGTSKGDATFGTYTLSGTAALAINLTFFGPLTLSSSGGATSATNPQFWPVTATVKTAVTTQTTSMSLYVMLEYVLPGNIGGNTGQGL